MNVKIQQGLVAFLGMYYWARLGLQDIIFEVDAAPRAMYQEFVNLHQLDFFRSAVWSYIAFFVAAVFLVSNLDLSSLGLIIALIWISMWACLLFASAWEFRASVNRGHGNPGEYRTFWQLLRLTILAAAFALVLPLFFEARFFQGILATITFLFWISGDYFKACHPARR